jgi:predicted negative regulator of RcsB-dependent stress response
MAIELLDEHEQGEQVRKWLRDNGTAIIGGIAIGIAMIFGWQWWTRSQAERNVTAAVQYQALVEAAERNDAAAVEQFAATLGEEYEGTPYAFLAALQRAEQAFAAGQPEAAVAALEHARATASDPATRGLVTLRLARARMAQGQAEEALALLGADDLAAYAGLAGELRGDALLSLGRADEARSAYSDALEALDAGAPSRSLVEMKLADLGGADTAGEA